MDRAAAFSLFLEFKVGVFLLKDTKEEHIKELEPICEDE